MRAKPVQVDDLEFVRIARSLAVQESRSLRAYGRMGVVYLPGRTRTTAFDEALAIVDDGIRSVRSHWGSLLPASTPLRREESPDSHVSVA